VGELYTFIVGFFKSGGFFLYPLALIFIVGVSIVIERAIFLTIETTRNRSVWEEVVPPLSAGNFKKVLDITRNSSATIATVLNYGIARLAHARRREDVEKAMDESMLEIIPRMEKRTHYLSALANIGRLTGLLGTIVGLISAFASIANANPAEKASLLAASISVAMNNTASGLICAITLLLSHMFLEAKTTKLIDSLEIASVKFLNSVVERRENDGGNEMPQPTRPMPPPGPAGGRPGSARGML
jgi:biopolymer transport protein ExbB